MTQHCACCGKPFAPRPQVPDQAYCSDPDCQRARKRQWQRAKLQSDPDYRDNQRAAQQALVGTATVPSKRARCWSEAMGDGSRRRERKREANRATFRQCS